MFVKTLHHLHPEIIKLSEGVKLLGREGCGAGAGFHVRLRDDCEIRLLGVREIQQLPH
jgi:hypothetical protein